MQRKIEILYLLHDQSADSSQDDELLTEQESDYPELSDAEAVAILADAEEISEAAIREDVEALIGESSHDDDFQFLSADEEKILAQAKQELSQYRKKIAVERARRKAEPQQAKRLMPRAKKKPAVKKVMPRSASAKTNKTSSDTGRIKIPSMAYVKKRAVTNSFFDWPIDLSSCWLSSPFGMRKHPRGGKKFHAGIDLAAMRGTPVMASASGVVAQAQYVAGYGNNIILNHNNKFKTRYAHLHKIYVKPGQAVEQGQKIGAVGATGYVRKSGRDGSHLHFEIHSDGRHVNPLKYLLNE